MNKVSLEIIGLTYSESSTGAYVLILGDKNSQRRLPIVIGSAEAESIAVGIEKHKNGRPHTHDLFIRFAHEFGIEITGEQGDDLTMVDARPSDAIAIAVRKGCEIYAYESVMEEAGIIMEDIEKESPDENEESTINKGVTKTSLDLLDLETLEDLLQEAIDNEDYQKAAQIRDEINRRK